MSERRRFKQSKILSERLVEAARGYPKTGYLNALQHKSLLSEIVATRVISDEPPTTRRPLLVAAAAAVVAVDVLSVATVAHPISCA
jgi:hypothetical protein